MTTLYDAYQAYERRVIRGEFSGTPKKTNRRPAPSEPIMEQLADLLIHTGLKLKRHYAAGKSMAWSPLTGSKP